MFEIFGPIARPAPGVLPLLLALAPLVGAAAFGDARRARVRALAALSACGLAALVFFAWSFRWPADERLVLTSFGVAARVGQLDLRLALGLDPLGAAASLAVSVVAARLVWAQRSRRRITLLCAMASAMQGVVLADGAATLALAFGVAALVGAVLGYVHYAHFVADRVADVALIGAAAVLFWALGGAWVDGQYVPELEPRLVVASGAPSAKPQPVDDDDDDDERQPPVARGARSTLSFGGLPGAYVLLDGSWLRDARKRLVVAPFADVPIAAGAHAVRLRVGAGSNDYVVPKLDAPANQPTTLALRGATTTFREIADDLASRDATGEPGAAALARRKFFGVPAAGVVLALLALGLAARARAFPFAPSLGDEPARALAAIGAVVLIARMPIGSASPRAAPAIAGVLAIGALLAASVALRNGRASALLSGEIALAGAGAIAGAPALAVVHAFVACVLLAREKDGGSAALFGLVPTRAAFAASCAALPFGGAAAALVLAASFVLSCALARRGRPRAVGALAASFGFVVALDPRAFGSSLEPLASRALAPSLRAAPAAPAPSLAIFGLALALAAFAFAIARRRALAVPEIVLRVAEAPARATSALARAIAATLLELESRFDALVRAADSIIRGLGSLGAVAEEVALVGPTKGLRFALPPERALRFVLVPVAIVAAALFAVPWAS